MNESEFEAVNFVLDRAKTLNLVTEVVTTALNMAYAFDLEPIQAIQRAADEWDL